MSVPAAYLTVVLVWATTPIGIAFSGATLHPMLAAGLRMLIAAVLGAVLVKLLRIPMCWRARELKSHGWALVGIFGALGLSYMAAQRVPSGLISVFFGLSPMLSAILAQWLLDEPAMPLYKWAACLLALFGLAVLFLDDVLLTADMLGGFVMLLVAVLLFSVSAVMVKRTDAQMHPLAQTVGSLILSVPLFAVAWWLMDGQMPVIDWASPSPWAVLYLALFGSLLGFVSYYHILRYLAPTTVALITLVTPVFALYLGFWFNDEELSPAMLQGTGLIMAGLVVFFFGGLLRKRLRATA
ncbi:DMT family transporter [Marinobacter zhejiangensis]|uniref:EamA-like transporter family protein n=1 Tax=Marinobacter zhejiangensis TaxID=488535 RepID=A0A1I4LHX6_9GAMM|nr:DMT family transporter [Marinobacter zhejiangensis]SFL90634.1 EamA-like transporter family protein [Marinobacter zhejiangensis]